MSGAIRIVRTNASRHDLVALWEHIAPQEIEANPPGLMSFGLLIALAAMARTYVVREVPGGRLCGIGFVADAGDRREMVFVKTRHLCERRPLEYARSVRELLVELAAREAASGHDRTPMYFHAPDDGGRAAAFFVRRGGCHATPSGIMCPAASAGKGDRP